MFHPLCWSDDAYSDQILKQNINAVVTIKFYPVCSHQTKWVFLEWSQKCFFFSTRLALVGWVSSLEAVKMFIKIDKANCISGQSTLLFKLMFKANTTLILHFAVQITKVSLRRNKIGNSGAKALATCLWNIDELDLMDCDITECEELCKAIQSLKRPVSFNLVSRHTVLKFVWRGYWENIQIRLENISWFCLKSNEHDVLTTAWKCYFINQKQPTVQRVCVAG